MTNSERTENEDADDNKETETSDNENWETVEGVKIP
jgi:hypothetical protein